MPRQVVEKGLGVGGFDTARPQHEDMPLVEPGDPPTRQIWAPAIHRFSSYAGIQRPANIGNGQSAAIIFAVPSDFTAWTRIRLVVSSNLTQNYNVTITVNGATCLELKNTHTQTDTRNYALTTNTFVCVDLSAILAAFFGALGPDDYCEMILTNNTVGFVVVYGLDLRY